MAIAIPAWLTSGNGPFAVTLTPGTRTPTTGAFSPGTLVTMTGELDDIAFDGDVVTENIRPMNRRKANHVIIEDDSNITLFELLKYEGVNILAAQVYGSDYFKIIITRGAQGWTFYGVRGFPRETIRNGKSVTAVTFSQIDVGDPNPAYA